MNAFRSQLVFPVFCLTFGLAYSLMGQGSNIDPGEAGPIRQANGLFDVITSDDVNQLAQLLRDGADPNQVNEEGHTPLHWALILADIGVFERATFEAVFTLLNHGANPNHPDEYGKTPLHYAVRHGVRESVALMIVLLEAGGDPNISTYERTPFEEALFWGSDAVAVIERATSQRPADYARKKADGNFLKVYTDGIKNATSEQERNGALKAAVSELVKAGVMSEENSRALYQSLLREARHVEEKDDHPDGQK